LGERGIPLHHGRQRAQDRIRHVQGSAVQELPASVLFVVDDQEHGSSPLHDAVEGERGSIRGILKRPCAAGGHSFLRIPKQKARKGSLVSPCAGFSIDVVSYSASFTSFFDSFAASDLMAATLRPSKKRL